MNGELAVQRTHSNRFGCIPQDQTIEVTLSRNTKTAGGIIGMSLNPAAVHKDSAEFPRQCQELSGHETKDSEHTHKDAGKKNE